MVNRCDKPAKEFFMKKFSIFSVILVCLLALGMAFTSCSNGSNGSSSEKGTLIISNLSTAPSEIITEVTTTNYDTGITKNESVPSIRHIINHGWHYLQSRPSQYFSLAILLSTCSCATLR
jgi:hypothetical protein